MRDDAWDEPTQDIEAERMLLSAMLAHPMAIEAAVESLMPEHFYRPAHQVIFRALVTMYAADEPVDAVTLMGWLRGDGDLKVLGGQGPLYLHELVSLAAAPQSAAYYARIILGDAVRRVLGEAGHRLVAGSRDAAGDPLQLGEAAISRLQDVLSGARPDWPVQTTEEFAKLDLSGVSGWVIPGLLGRMERAVFVAGEGAGKTTVLHQLAYCAAAGVHPFLWDFRCEPVGVLIIDLENPDTLLQRRIRHLEDTAFEYGAGQSWNPRNLVLLRRPEGINLVNPAEAFQLSQFIKRVSPDLIVAGPLYKMMLGSAPGDAKLSAHAAVSEFWDRIRARHKCALAFETHPPLGTKDGREIRPEGSAIWHKWPEFGIKLLQKSDGGLTVDRYRNDRVEGRTWPTSLTRTTFGGGWPWTANWKHGIPSVPKEDQ